MTNMPSLEHAKRNGIYGHNGFDDLFANAARDFSYKLAQLIDALPDPILSSPVATTSNMSGNLLAEPRSFKRGSTIRSVPSSENLASTPDSRRSAFSSFAASDLSSNLAMVPPDRDQSTPSPSPSSHSLRHMRGSVNEYTTKWNAGGVRAVDPPAPTGSPVLPDVLEQDEWDSTVGKAGLGKTGRVINKLVSDNDALKRDIKIEKLLAEEAKQAARLVEDKMERMVSDYESKLLEANVTKTLLARKERQVETLNAIVEAEKKKTQAAELRERSWREEMEKTRSESVVQVESATTHAALMEGRYNAISSHWRDQGTQVKNAIASVRTEIDELVEERRKDDEKIQILRDLCDQQDSNIKQLKAEKELLVKLFEQYKITQEEELKDIKEMGKKRDQEQEKILEESKEALNKLKWALNVKNNVKGAE